MRTTKRRSRQSPTTSGPTPAFDVVSLLDAFPGRITVWDADLRLVHANRAQLDLVDLGPEQLVGRLLPDVVGEDGMRALQPHVDGARAGRVERWIGQTRLPDETVADSDYLVAPFRAAEEDGLVMLAIDATARVHDATRALAHEAVVEAREAQLRSAAALSLRVAEELRAASAALDRLAATKDPDASYVEVIAILSTAIGELRSQLLDLLQEPAPRTSRTPLAPVSAPLTLQIEPAFDSAYAPGKDDERPPVDRRSAPGDATDVRLDDILRAALDALPCAVTAWTPEFTCTYANSAALAWYSLPAERLVGVAGRELLGDEAYEASLGYGHLAMEGHPQRFVRAVASARDEPSWARIDYVGQFRDGRAIGAIAVVRDVTSDVEAQRARAAAEHRSAELGRRRELAEQGLDPLLQRLFALTMTLSAFPPSTDRSHQVAATLAEISADLRALIDALESSDPG